MLYSKVHKKSRSKPLLIAVLLLLLVTQACSAFEPPLASINPTATPQASKSVEIDPLTTVTFQVDIPVDTPAEHPILLSLLDEVTGLGLNVSRREMQQVGESTYSITLPFPVGATIKYRYARQDSYIAEEHTTDQRPVRYRIYRVDGPGMVKDIVAAWSDGEYQGPVGRIMGKATNIEDGTPVPNLLVSAGGVNTVTSSTGEYLIEGLPPGLHNLVLYAFDGSFHTYQQGALIAAQSTTPADIELTAAPKVKIIFSVSVPEETLPAVPIRLAGNLYQLGNTFADLSGGVNTLAARMPSLTPLSDGRYALEIELPAGAYLEYKYTLGDGFWNSEYTPAGDFRIRTMTVPDQDTVIRDTIDSWGQTFNAGPILFDLTVPDSTPEFDYISIQFSPFGWTEPVPMWKLEENHWVYMLYSPVRANEEFTYRYCRNDQCGRADDQLTAGYSNPGRKISIPDEPNTISIPDAVDSWRWFTGPDTAEPADQVDINPRTPEFIAGVEIQSYYHPSLTPRLPVAFKEIQSIGANWIFMTPTWTYTRQNPPVLELVSGKDQSWNDLSRSAESARSFGMQVAYYPMSNFPADMADWWSSSSRDFPWWQVWFERYQNFIYSFADQAQLDGVSGLVIGGEGIAPALPDGELPDGSASGVPSDAEQRWREIISGVRNRFEGTLFWGLPAGNGQINPPPFIEDLDQVYLLWSLPLTRNENYTPDQLLKTAEEYLDEEVYLINISLEMPITVAAAYPSAQGGLLGCIQNTVGDNQESCLSIHLLEPPHPDNPAIQNDLAAQAAAYSALLAAIDDREWIDGFVARGFYTPARLEDKSASIHGKPSQQVLNKYFKSMVPSTSPE